MRRFIPIIVLLAGCNDPIDVESTSAPPRPERPVQQPPPSRPQPETPAADKPEPKPERKPTREPVDAKKLTVEAVELANPERLCHGLIAFVADREHAQAALDAHRSHKEEQIAKLPRATAGDEAGLYLIWGHYPSPSLALKDIRVGTDPRSGRIRVTLPPWSGERPKDGIGLDWRKGDRSGWKFVGYRVKLSGRSAGDYEFEVSEVKGAQERILSEGSFSLKR